MHVLRGVSIESDWYAATGRFSFPHAKGQTETHNTQRAACARVLLHVDPFFTRAVSLFQAVLNILSEAYASAHPEACLVCKNLIAHIAAVLCCRAAIQLYSCL